MQDITTEATTEPTVEPTETTTVNEPVEEQIDNQEAEPQEEPQEETPLTFEDVITFLETTQGKKLLQPNLDTFFTKSLESWKQNNLEKICADEQRILNDPKLQELNALEKQIEFESQIEQVMYKVKSHKKLIPLGVAEAFAQVGTEKAFRSIDAMVYHLKRNIPIMVKNTADNLVSQTKKGG